MDSGTRDVLNAEDVLRDQDRRQDELFKLRRRLEEGYGTNSFPHICHACKQPIALRGAAQVVAGLREEHFFFKHFRPSPTCDVIEERLDRDTVRRLRYNGLKESWEHIRAKEMLFAYLQKEPRLVTSEHEKTIRDQATPRNYRKPDVRGIFEDKDIAFEIQVSPELLDVIVARKQFYCENSMFLMWVFLHFSTDKNFLQFFHKDILYSNNHNVFAFDEAAQARSLAMDRLVLHCFYHVPEVSSGELSYEWKDEFVTLDDLTFVNGRWDTFYYDTEGVAQTMREELAAQVPPPKEEKVWPKEVAEAAAAHGVHEEEIDLSAPNERVDNAVEFLREFYQRGYSLLRPQDEDPIDRLQRSDYPALNKRLDLNGPRASKRMADLFVKPEKMMFLEYICERDLLDLDVNLLSSEGHSMLLSIVMQYPDHREFEHRLALLFMKGYKLTIGDRGFLERLYDNNQHRKSKGNRMLLERWGYATIYAALRKVDVIDAMMSTDFLRAVLSLKTRTVLYREYNTLAEVSHHILQYKEGLTGVYKKALKKYGLYAQVCNEDRTGQVMALMEQFRGGRADDETDFYYFWSNHLEAVFPELMQVEDPRARTYVE